MLQRKSLVCEGHGRKEFKNSDRRDSDTTCPQTSHQVTSHVNQMLSFYLSGWFLIKNELVNTIFWHLIELLDLIDRLAFAHKMQYQPITCISLFACDLITHVNKSDVFLILTSDQAMTNAFAALQM